MAALNLLRSFAVLEVHLLSGVEESYPYRLVAVDRISTGRHQWCILHLEKDGSAMKVIIEKDSFSEAE